MSFCRFSSMDFGCDVYCFEDCNGGYTIHVARLRVVGPVPHLPDLSTAALDKDAFYDAYCAQMEYLKTAKRVPIGGMYDGDSWYNVNFDEFMYILDTLKGAGYRFPDSLFDLTPED